MNFVKEQFPLALAAAVVVASLLLGLLTRRPLLSLLGYLTEKGPRGADDAFVASLRRPLPIWFLLAGLHIAGRLVDIPSKFEGTFDKLLVSLLIVSLTLWAGSFISRLIELGAPPLGVPAAPAVGVVRYAVRLVVLAVGLLVLLSTLGVSVTPLLTTVGIGGLAVALGLQETLANFFAGIQLTLAGVVRVGDFIRLESGQEGYVEDIHWRATKIRTLPNNAVIIPNSKLAQSVLTNYHLPTQEVSVTVPVSVHYKSNLEHVEKVSLAVAREIQKTVLGAVPEFEPSVRFTAFSPSSIDLSVSLRAREFADTFLVRHEFIKALVPAFARENIVIPLPTQAVNTEQERAAAPPAREKV